MAIASLRSHAWQVPEDALDFLLRRRQLVEDLARHEMPDGRGFGFQQRYIRFHFDGIHHLTDIENDIHANRLGGPDGDIAAHELLETRGFVSNFVDARIEIEKAVDSFVGGDRVVRKTGAGMLCPNSDTRNDPGTGVGNRSDNRTLPCLSERTCRA